MDPASRQGSVLILVLWIALGLVSIALYFAHSMTLELRASDNRTSGIAADQAIEGAARYVSYVLTTYATNGVVPDLSEYQAEAVPVGDARFWIIGRDNSYPMTHPNQVSFGLVDESSKLNLNSASTNVIALLPRMTTDLTAAIFDWRGTNGNGASQFYYAMQQPPYQRKGAPFETIDELRLVYGTTMDILAGEDLNRNGILDANEKDEDGNGQIDPGLLEYVTVYSREPNMHSDGAARINVNDPTQLRSLLRSSFGPGRAGQILRRLGIGGGPTPVATVPLRGMLQFYVRSGMTANEFAQICNDVTVSTALFTRGRVNINTASVTVLSCLPGMDTGTAQQLVNYRQTNPNNLGSIAWIVDALGANSPTIRALQAGDYITTQSYQFAADIAAVGPYGRGYRRVKFIFDISEGSSKIIYRQDLSRLGWALGEDVRQALLVKETQ
ncbi:MAG: helix-hairpin-helix domain-containing protein [Verrucomicrobiia bacterium]|jgi:type II secretory pathway component PulK